MTIVPVETGRGSLSRPFRLITTQTYINKTRIITKHPGSTHREVEQSPSSRPYIGRQHRCFPLCREHKGLHNAYCPLPRYANNGTAPAGTSGRRGSTLWGSTGVWAAQVEYTRPLCWLEKRKLRSRGPLLRSAKSMVTFARLNPSASLLLLPLCYSPARMYANMYAASFHTHTHVDVAECPHDVCSNIVYTVLDSVLSGANVVILCTPSLQEHIPRYHTILPYCTYNNHSLMIGSCDHRNHSSHIYGNITALLPTGSTLKGCSKVPPTVLRTRIESEWVWVGGW